MSSVQMYSSNTSGAGAGSDLMALLGTNASAGTTAVTGNNSQGATVSFGAHWRSMLSSAGLSNSSTKTSETESATESVPAQDSPSKLTKSTDKTLLSEQSTENASSTKAQSSKTVQGKSSKIASTVQREQGVQLENTQASVDSASSVAESTSTGTQEKSSTGVRSKKVSGEEAITVPTESVSLLSTPILAAAVQAPVQAVDLPSTQTKAASLTSSASSFGVDGTQASMPQLLPSQEAASEVLLSSVSKTQQGASVPESGEALSGLASGVETGISAVTGDKTARTGKQVVLSGKASSANALDGDVAVGMSGERPVTPGVSSSAIAQVSSKRTGLQEQTPTAQLVASSQSLNAEKSVSESNAQAAEHTGNFASASSQISGKTSSLSTKEKQSGSASTVTLHATSNSVPVAEAAVHAVASTQTASYDSSGASRELAAMQPQATTHAQASETSSVSTFTGANTFTALDAGASQSGTTWMHTGAHQAEAGYQDPNLGWVSVRAELSGGSVHASVVPSSASAAESLGQHLGGLQNYLNEHDTPVSSLSMASPEGQNGSMGQSANQNAYSSAERSDTRTMAQGMRSETGTAATDSGGSSLYEPFLREGSSISLVA